jgi:hypothetical protein
VMAGEVKPSVLTDGLKATIDLLPADVQVRIAIAVEFDQARWIAYGASDTPEHGVMATVRDMVGATLSESGSKWRCLTSTRQQSRLTLCWKAGNTTLEAVLRKQDLPCPIF